MRILLFVSGFVAILLCSLTCASAETKTEAYVEFSTSDDAQWTQTTLEAATSPEHKQALKHARKATISGEVVDVSCYLQLGKRGQAHAACGRSCVQNGQPYGLLDDAGNLTLIIEEQHHPRRDGQVSLRESFARLMGQRIKATGMLTERKGIRVLFVQAPPKVASKMECGQ